MPADRTCGLCNDGFSSQSDDSPIIEYHLSCFELLFRSLRSDGIDLTRDELKTLTRRFDLATKPDAFFQGHDEKVYLEGQTSHARRLRRSSNPVWPKFLTLPSELRDIILALIEPSFWVVVGQTTRLAKHLLRSPLTSQAEIIINLHLPIYIQKVNINGRLHISRISNDACPEHRLLHLRRPIKRLLICRGPHGVVDISSKPRVRGPLWFKWLDINGKATIRAATGVGLSFQR